MNIYNDISNRLSVKIGCWHMISYLWHTGGYSEFVKDLASKILYGLLVSVYNMYNGVKFLADTLCRYRGSLVLRNLCIDFGVVWEQILMRKYTLRGYCGHLRSVIDFDSKMRIHIPQWRSKFLSVIVIVIEIENLN